METTDATPVKTASTESGVPEETPVSLSPKAVEMVKDALATQKLEGHSLRIAVVPGGCAGFNYDLDLVKDGKPGDVKLAQDGVSILIDAVSFPYLKGTVIDYVQDGMRAGFVFKNPNARSSCGCGSSFQA